MKKVFKYRIDITDFQTVMIPEGAQFLHLGLQSDYVCIWALIDPDKRSIPYKIQCVGTGHIVEPEYTVYLGTILMYDGNLVFHFFTEQK